MPERTLVTSLDQARRAIEEWRIDYNNRERPHSSLDNLTPEEFIRQEKEKLQRRVLL